MANTQGWQNITKMCDGKRPHQVCSRNQNTQKTMQLEATLVMDELTGWDLVKIGYLCGAVVAGMVTFRLSNDPSATMRLLCAVLIAYTWPLSFLVVLVIGMF